jgi:hypothetical protein
MDKKQEKQQKNTLLEAQGKTKRVWVILLLGVFFISLASALTYQQSQGLDFKQTCTSDGRPCNATATCNVSFQYPNGTYVVSLGAMTNQLNGDFNYTLSTVQTEVQGTYVWNMYCCQIADCGESHGTFFINYLGKELTTSKSIIYIALFGILTLFFILILYFMGKIPDGNDTNESGEIISLSKLKYLKSVLLFTSWIILIAIFFITSNLAFAYLEEQLFAKVLFLIFRICFLLTFPIIIVWFIWIFASIIQDNKMKRLIAKGIYPTGGL